MISCPLVRLNAGLERAYFGVAESGQTDLQDEPIGRKRSMIYATTTLTLTAVGLGADPD